MKFCIHENTLKSNKSESGKAIYFTHSYSGFNTGKTIEWFPMSQLEIGAFNEVGWATINIPDWILKQKQLISRNSLVGGFEELEIADPEIL